jgi:DnaJ-class molecular chaperone
MTELIVTKATTCLTCGDELEWEMCQSCGGEGVHDEYDNDPVNGHEYETCYECKGEGGYLECPNAENHSMMPVTPGDN